MNQAAIKLNFDQEFDSSCQKIGIFYIVFQSSINSQIVMCQTKKGQIFSSQEKEHFIEQLKLNLGEETIINTAREHQFKDQTMIVLEIQKSDRQKIDQIQKHIGKRLPLDKI